MDGARIERVSKWAESYEKYHKLYGLLKSVLPEYVGRIELLEHAQTHIYDLLSYAVLVEREVVGGYVLQNKGEIACLEFIGLTEGIRGRGLGSKMVNDACSVSRWLGSKELRAETHHKNLSQFKRMGFRQHASKERGIVEVRRELF